MPELLNGIDRAPLVGIAEITEHASQAVHATGEQLRRLATRLAVTVRDDMTSRGVNPAAAEEAVGHLCTALRRAASACGLAGQELGAIQHAVDNVFELLPRGTRRL